MFRLAIVGDVHYSTAGEAESSLLLHRSADLLDLALRQIAENLRPPDLIVQIGDMIGGTEQSPEEARADLERAVARFDRAGLPWTWIPGNHDAADCGGMRYVLPHLRRERPYGELLLGDVVLLLLDSTCEQMHGRIGAEQQRWLEAKLDEHCRRRILVFIHHVFDWSVADGMYIENADVVRPLLIGAQAAKAVFMGHAHTNRIACVDGMYEIVTSALSSWPLTFRWIDLDENTLVVRTEKLHVSPEIEAEAIAAWNAYLRDYRGESNENDLNADLPLR